MELWHKILKYENTTQGVIFISDGDKGVTPQSSAI